MKKDLGISIEKKIHWIKAYLDETLTSEEKVVFQQWLDESETNRVLLERIRNERILYNKMRFVERNDKEKGWNNIQRKIRKRPVVSIRFMRYAAMWISIVLVSIAIYQVIESQKEENNKLLIKNESKPLKEECNAYLELTTGERLMLDTLNKMMAQVEGAVIKTEDKGTIIVNEQKMDSLTEKFEYNRLVIPRKGEYKIILADGTQVWINSQSVLEFPSRFMEKERRVKLMGEAYFQVTKNIEQPFIVEVEDKEIQVLGTSFNVNDYEGRFVTTLVTGKVNVRIGKDNYTLDPSMQICVENNAVTLKKVDTKEFTAWKDGLFVFKKQRLQDVLDILSRWYDIDIFYQNEDLKELHFTGTIERHNDIAEVVKFLEKTDMVNFKINGKTLVVSK